MKNSAYLLIFLCLASLSAHASMAAIDKVFIKFNDTHTVETIQRDSYNIIVLKGEMDDNGYSAVSISIKNNAPANSLYIFDRTMIQKELRQKYKIIVKDEVIKRMLETKQCSFISDSYCIVPLQLVTLNQVDIRVNQDTTLILPVYEAKERGWLFKKMQIIDWDYLEIVISIEEKPDSDLPDIRRQCDSIINEISKQQFCRHPLHIPKLQQQETPYIKEVGRLQALVLQKLSVIPEYSKYREQYNDLKNQLENIRFEAYEVDDCGDASSHLTVPGKSSGSRPTHCKYCDMSLEQIYYHLDNLYQKVDNNLTNKKTAVSEVNKIMDCCKNHSKHASEWNSGKSKFKKGIETLCKNIKNY